MLLINDLPTSQDYLSFERYTTPLANVIRNPDSSTPFTIGIFGSWGSGKSSLLQQLDEQLNPSGDMNFISVWFNPWVYRDEKNLIVPLLNTLHDQLIIDNQPNAKVSAKKIATVLANIGASLLLKTITAGEVTLKDLKDHENEYIESNKRTMSTMYSLQKDLQRAVNVVTENGKTGRIVFFIDDLDRCQPEVIVELLESIKIFLNLEHCFFVLAVDREVVQRGIQIKYHEFDFKDERKERIGEEYLEKMVQLPLYLYPLSPKEIESFLSQLSLEKTIQEHTAILSKVLPPNPRKIKNIINLFLVNLAIIEQSNIKTSIDEIILGKLIVVQVQDYFLFLALQRNPELPEYLRKIYQGKLSIDSSSGWEKLGIRADDLRKLASKYHKPGSWIACIFGEDEPFPSGSDLLPYFNLIETTSSVGTEI